MEKCQDPADASHIREASDPPVKDKIMAVASTMKRGQHAGQVAVQKHLQLGKILEKSHSPVRLQTSDNVTCNLVAYEICF